MGTNEGWPEAFGFSLVGGSPPMINEVEEGGSAQQAGLQVGDFVVELNGENVEEWSRDEVVELARRSLKVPPSLVVVSRVKEVILPRSPSGGFGITFRGNSPVFIRSVDFESPARFAGLRSGDLLVELNNRNVRYSMKMEVLELLKSTTEKLQLKVVVGGLASSSIANRAKKQRKVLENRVSQETLAARYEKARLFHSKVNYYLMGETLKKTQLMTLLQLYAKDRDINSLGASINILFDTPTQKRLCKDIRSFIHPSHHDRFDALILFDPNRSLSDNHLRHQHWQGSLMWNKPLGAEERKSHMRSSMPDLSHPMGRTVQIIRENGSFGFSLNGNAPVVVRSVDKGGASEHAGLKPGDQLLQLNGINIRGATHSQVVQLLRSSGPHPILVVASPPAPYEAAGYGTLPRSLDADFQTKRNINAFKKKMGEVLSAEEKQMVMKQLGKFSNHKEIPELVKSLSWILDNPTKTVLYHYICQLLPEEAQREFDRIAAAVLAGETAVSIMSNTGSLGGTVVPHRSLRLSSTSSSSLSSTQSREQERELNYERNEQAVFMRQKSGASYDHSRGRGSEGHTSGRSSREHGSGGERSGGAGRGVSEGGGSERGGGWGGRRGRGSGGLGEVERGGSKREAREESQGIREGREHERGREQVQKDIQGANQRSPNRQTSKDSTEPSSPTRSVQTPAQTPNVSAMSTPGSVPLPPNPPPTPAMGVGGVPIPPPPPPNFSATNQSHLKRVNWEKISGAEGTIWKELSGLEEALEYFEIEEKFANQAPKTGATKKSSKPSILNERKAYNIAILLGHLKLSFGAIKEAILRCDETVLSEQHLRQMEAFAPDQKECLGFARFHGDPSVLSKADRFACEMSTIPGYQQRLRAMIFKLHFKSKVDEIKPDLEAIVRASGELQSSKNLKRVLEIVLAVGNYMNAGNRRVGKAVGFRIKYLTQLKDLKTTDNKSTLLHFVAATVERKFPQVLEFSEDLRYVSVAARVSGETLEVEINELTKGLQDIQKAVEELSSQRENTEDKFCDIMTKFVSWADQELTDLLKAYALMKKEYSSVLKFYGEEPTKSRIDEFFGTFASFISDFERAVKENRDSREKQAMLEMKAKEKDLALKKKGGFKLFSRSSRNMDDEIKKELETKSKSKKIDVTALEESRKAKALENTAKQQQDFRHLLKKTNPTTPTRQDSRKSKSSEEKEKKRSRSRQSSTESSSKLVRVESKGKSRHLSSTATELTGSWDYIPSAPTSTVRLDLEDGEGQPEDNVFSSGNQEEVEPFSDTHISNPNAWNDLQPVRRQLDLESGFNDYDDEEGDDITSSPPLVDLQVPIAANTYYEGDQPSRKALNQEFDFETHF